MNPTRAQSLRERLSLLAERQVRRRASEGYRAGWREAARALPLLVLLFPAVLVVLNVAAWGLGREVLALPLPLLIGLALGPAILALALWPLWRRGAPLPRGEALVAADAAAGTRGRFAAADEFLARGLRSDFELAAVEDAEERLPEALEQPLAPLPPLVAPRSGLASALVFAAVLVGFLALFRPDVPDRARPAAGADTTERSAELTPPRPLPKPPTPEAEEAPEPEPREERPARPRPPARSSNTEPGEVPLREVPDEARESVGSSGRGQSSQATSARGSSPSRGSPSSEGATSKEDRRPSKPSRRKLRPKPERPQTEEPRERVERDSGATAGRGSGSGSQKNPVGTDWSSKDQVVSDEEQELEEDEEVEDDEESSLARGGVQPNLRDRRPPVSRDLSIGFGNRPSPDANGRGGPSQQKKSRGTASLVLGVPVPDHVKGQPNPGRTKVTQERVEPRFEEAEPVPASARGRLEVPVDPTARPALPPWARPSVARYFEELRRRTAPWPDSKREAP